MPLVERSSSWAGGVTRELLEGNTMLRWTSCTHGVWWLVWRGWSVFYSHTHVVAPHASGNSLSPWPIEPTHVMPFWTQDRCATLSLISLLNLKFFCAKGRLSLVKLGYISQHPGEDLDTYVRRFHNKALDSCDPVEDKLLVDVCLLWMIEEYHIFLENLSFPSFSRLIDACHTKHSVRPSSASWSSSSSSSRKKSLVATVKQGKRSK